MAEVAQGELQVLSNDYQKLQEGGTDPITVASISLLTRLRSTDDSYGTSKA